MKLFLRISLTLALVLTLGPPLLTTANAQQQDDDAFAEVLSRYGSLNVQRNGAAVDTELAQRMYRRGNTYSNLERYEEAIAEYRKAVAADPGFTEALRNLANTYYYLERYDEAKPFLARFVALQEGEGTTAGLIAAVSTLGELERNEGNYDVSVVYDLKAIELDPGNDSQVHIMANMYLNNDHPGYAIRIYEKAIEVMPGNAFYYRTLGRIHEQNAELDRALARYEQAAEADPDSSFYEDLVESTRARLQR
ncbi:MAG: tetratricopeptide repeat protein [Pseudohongiellaceae bacterium]